MYGFTTRTISGPLFRMTNTKPHVNTNGNPSFNHFSTLKKTPILNETSNLKQIPKMKVDDLLKIFDDCMMKAQKDLHNLKITDNYENEIIGIMNQASQNLRRQIEPLTNDKDMPEQDIFTFVKQCIEKNRICHENKITNQLNQNLKQMVEKNNERDVAICTALVFIGLLNIWLYS